MVVYKWVFGRLWGVLEGVFHDVKTMMMMMLLLSPMVDIIPRSSNNTIHSDTVQIGFL